MACRESPTIAPVTGDRVLLIGIDGATWDVMRPLMAAGRMPTVFRLVGGGWSGTLRSMEPMLSPALWTTVATGKSPQQHGIHGFLASTGNDGAEVPVTSNLRRAETLWTIASSHGRRVNVVGWYVTWPVEEVNGVMVSDRFIPADGPTPNAGPTSLTPDAPGVFPANLESELRPLMVRADRFLHPAEREFHEMFKVYPVDATRVAIGEHLGQYPPADLTMLYLWGTDRMQHLCWKYYQPDTWSGPPMTQVDIVLNGQQIPNYYADVDGFLGRLLARAGPRDTVLIVSDHGFGPASPEVQRLGIISGEHRPEGIIIAAGNHVRAGKAERAPALLDIAPTVLYLLGLPVGKDMEGQIIRELVDSSFLEAHPPAFVPTYEPGQTRRDEKPIRSSVDEDIKRQLRALGYIQ